MGKIMMNGIQYGVGGTQKASEITYESGTVADALTPQSVSVSPVSSYVSSGTITCNKIGHVVVVGIASLQFSASGSADAFATGLPKPVSEVEAPIFNFSDQKSYRVRIASNGALTFWYQTIPTGQSMYGQIVYVTNE